MVSFEKQSGVSKEKYNSPFRMVLVLVFTTFMVDLGLMVVLNFLPSFQGWVAPLIDGFFLVVLLIPVLYYAVFRPMVRYITEREKAENELSNLNRKNQLILNSAAEGILGLDLYGRQTFFNESATRMLGYSAEELVGHSGHSLWHHTKPDGSIYPEDECFIHATLRDGTVHRISNEVFWRKDGTSFPVEYSNTPIYENGKVVGSVVTFVDITNRKLAEEEILKFKLGIECSSDAVFITDPDGRITYVNEAFEKIYGYTWEETIGQTPRIIKSGLLSQNFYQHFWGKLLNKGVVLHEIVNKSKDGSLMTIDSSNNPILDSLGNITGFLSVNRNITDRKQAETERQVLSEIMHGFTTTADLGELLKLIHHSLQKVLYAENCFFALYDPKTKLFNFPYFVDQFDPIPEPITMDKSCSSYVFRTGKSVIITPQVFKQLEAQNEVTLVGSVSPSWIGAPLQTSDRVIGVLVLQHYEKENVYNEGNLRFLDSIGSQLANVIERKRAEEDLAKSISLLTATIESTADGILVVDKNGKTTKFNKKFIELWQIPSSVISIGDDESMLSFVLDQLKDPDSFLRKIEELYSNADEISFDVIQFKDGRFFERYSQSQKHEGQNVGRVWSFRDITKRKLAEEALHESQDRLHELNATKDKFFSIIAHDLKNPFNAIVGLSSILAEQARKKNYDGIEEYATIIQDSSQRAMLLLSNLLEWARLQTGRMKFTPELTEINALTQEEIELLNDTAHQKSITILNKVAKNTNVYADKFMIGTVLRNLISNAIKFTNSDGVIVVSSELKLDKLLITVSDNGVGISEIVVPKLFRIDENNSTTGTNNEVGTGLGLILCKEFVEKHGGTIWVESEIGKGSKFSFTISLNQMNVGEPEY